LELKEEIRINAPRDKVFAALNDVAILKQAIPGCEEMEAVSDTEFTATLMSKVGPLKARFKGQVTLSDVVAPESYTLTGEGKGGPAGHAKIRSQVRLVEDGEATIMHYDVKADIGGKLAQLGGHLVEKTSKKLASEFFQKFEEILNPDRQEAEVPVAETEAGAPWLWIAGGALVLIVIAWLVL
jgi:uncharacterized protein